MSLNGQIKSYLAGLEQLRRRLRRFTTDSSIWEIVLRMRWVDNDIQRLRRFPISDLYYILKAAISMYDNKPQVQSEMNSKDLNSLMAYYHSLDSPVVEIAKQTGDSAMQLIKWIGQFCQFPFQDAPTSPAIARSIFLYKDKQGQIDYEKEYNRITGITIDMHVYGCLLAFSLTQKSVVLAERIKGSSLEIAEPENWTRFLRTISADYEIIAGWLEKHDLRSPLFSMYSLPFLIRYPVIQIDSGEMVSVWPNFTLSFLCYGPYYILKSEYGNEFTHAFGNTFQRYVASLLQSMERELGQSYIDESAFTAIKATQKPDFAVYDESQRILIPIEVKATEEKLRIDEDCTIRDLKAQIGKAVQQCHALYEKSLNDKEPSIPDEIDACIPLVITLKPYHFANARHYRENVVIPVQNNRNEETYRECTDNYQVLSIDDLELLVRYCIAMQQDLSTVLLRKLAECPEDAPRAYIVALQKEQHSKGVEDIGIPGVTETVEGLFDVMTRSLDVEFES